MSFCNILKFSMSLLYTLCGISAFVIFLILQIYPAAVLGFVTGIISGACAHIIWLHKGGRLNIWYELNELSQLFMLGFLTALFSTSCLVFHAVLLVGYQGDKWPIEIIVNTVWSLIAIKSGLLLMFNSYKFSKEMRRTLINATLEE